jgi:hypothetical protein
MGQLEPELERQRLRQLYSHMSAGELQNLAADWKSLTDVARQVLQYELTFRQLERKPDTTGADDIHDVRAENEWADEISSTLLPLEAHDNAGPPHSEFSSEDDREQRDDHGDDDDEEELEEAELEDADHEDSQYIMEERLRAGANLYGQAESLVHVQLVTIRRFRDLPEALLAKGGLNSAGIECRLIDDNMVRLDWFMSNFVGGIKLQVKPEDIEAANAILDQPIPEDFEVDGVGEYSQPRCPKCQSLDTAFEELNKPIAYGSAFLNLPLPIHHQGWRCHTCGCEWKEAAGQK